MKQGKCEADFEVLDNPTNAPIQEQADISEEAKPRYFIKNIINLDVLKKSGMQHNSGSMGTCETGATGATTAAQEAQENAQEESVVTEAEELAEEMNGAQYGEVLDINQGIADI